MSSTPATATAQGVRERWRHRHRRRRRHRHQHRELRPPRRRRREVGTQRGAAWLQGHKPLVKIVNHGEAEENTKDYTTNTGVYII